MKQKGCRCIIDPDERIVCEHTIEKCDNPENPFGGLAGAPDDRGGVGSCGANLQPEEWSYATAGAQH